MRDHEQAMLLYARLADLSQQKRQLVGRDKFLILTAAAACRAGWPEVAARCRQLVLENNASHLIGGYPTLADALRSPEFQPFLRRLEKFCGVEKAEHLLHGLGIAADMPSPDKPSDAGRGVLELLSGAHWP